MDELKDKIAVITGGAGGIGAAAARIFAEEGASGLIIADLNRDEAELAACQIKNDTGCECIAAAADVSVVSDVAELFGHVLDAFGTVDILVNCAGICRTVKMDSLTEQLWSREMDVNLKSAFFCSREAMKIMKPKKYGKIVTMSSISGRVGGIRTSASYVSSKGGIMALTKYLAKEGAPHNIYVNSVSPGVIDTDMTRDFVFDNSEVPLGRKGTAREVGNLIMFLCSDRASYITGTTIDINGGSFMI